MSKNYMYDKLNKHWEHDIEIVGCGGWDNPENLWIECMDCNEVIISAKDFGEDYHTLAWKALDNLVTIYYLQYLDEGYEDADADRMADEKVAELMNMSVGTLADFLYE